MKRKKQTLRTFDFTSEMEFSNYTLQESLDLFLQEKKSSNLSPVSIDVYRYHGGLFIRFIGDKNAQAFSVCTPDKYRSFIISQQKTKKDVSVASVARSIRAWFYWMMENHYIQSFYVKIPKYQKTIPDTYSDEELRLLLRQPDKQCTEVEYETWVFINLAIATGLRLSSLLGIRVRDVVFSEKTVRINQTKNKRALLLVLNNEILGILHMYIRQMALSQDDYLFCTGEKKRLANRSMEDYVRRYSAKRGVTKNKCIHAFRHTFARNYYLQFHDMYRLKELLGHTMISTTEQYLGSLGLITSREIEYNPQVLYSSCETTQLDARKRRGKRHLS